MEVLLLGIYSFFVWLIFFKFKWLRWTMAAAVVVITIPIVGLAGLMLVLNVVAPSALDVQVVKYVVQVIPRVTGRVIDVPVAPNRLVRRGSIARGACGHVQVTQRRRDEDPATKTPVVAGRRRE